MNLYLGSHSSVYLQTSQVVLVVKNPPAHAGDIRDAGCIPGSGRSPGEGIGYPLQFYWASLVAQKVKNLPMVQETWVLSLGWEDPLEKEWLPTPVFLPGEFHGWRSLAGYSPWGCKEPEIEMEITTYITIRNMTFGINLRKNVQN